MASLLRAIGAATGLHTPRPTNIIDAEDPQRAQRIDRGRDLLQQVREQPTAATNVVPAPAAPQESVEQKKPSRQPPAHAAFDTLRLHSDLLAIRGKVESIDEVVEALSGEEADRVLREFLDTTDKLDAIVVVPNALRLTADGWQSYVAHSDSSEISSSFSSSPYGWKSGTQAGAMRLLAEASQDRNKAIRQLDTAITELAKLVPLVPETVNALEHLPQALSLPLEEQHQVITLRAGSGNGNVELRLTVKGWNVSRADAFRLLQAHWTVDAVKKHVLTKLYEKVAAAAAPTAYDYDGVHWK